MRKATKENSTITVEPLEEHIPIRGSFASGDDAADKELEDELIYRLDGLGDIWAWCCVKVRVTFRGLDAEEYLGGCSYENEQGFKVGGYYDDMVQTCLDRINAIIEDLCGECAK